MLRAVVARLRPPSGRVETGRCWSTSQAGPARGAGSGGRGQFGQPTEWSHPHIIRRGEVNHGISGAEFRARREGLVDRLLAQGQGGLDMRHLLLIPAATRQYMVEGIPYSYRQDADFRYLTGCLQPDTLLAIQFSSSGSKSILFCKENSSYEEAWEGARLGLGEAVTFLGMDEAAPLSALEGFVDRFIKSNRKAGLWMDLPPRPPPALEPLLQLVTRARSRLGSLESPRPAVHQMRSIKSPAEVQLMRRTCKVGAEAMRRTMAASRGLATEGELLATVEHEARMQGACRSAYPAVVASGEAACAIHYIKATAALRPGDMVLMDAGCEFHGYSSDITRTWPPGGRFSGAQLGMYEAVLDCQTELIRGIRPGESSIGGLYTHMMEVLARRLQEVGLLGRGEEQLSARALCPHHVSHHLGMDVHDTNTVSKGAPLLPGMVITIEPGCYVPTTMAKVDPKYLGLGVRIEDDILITETGVEVLSAGCPTHPQDILDLVNS